MDIKDLNTSLIDHSAQEYQKELLTELEKHLFFFDTDAMATNTQSFLQGKKEMLNEIINYIKKTMPC